MGGHYVLLRPQSSNVIVTGSALTKKKPKDHPVRFAVPVRRAVAAKGGRYPFLALKGRIVQGVSQELSATDLSVAQCAD